MSAPQTSRDQRTRRWLLPVLAGGAACAVVALLAVVTSVSDREAVDFMREANMTTGSVWWLGSGAMLNDVVWGAAAALAAFVASLHAGHRAAMLLFAGVSAALLADDALMLHDNLGHHAGVPEAAFYAVYAVAGLCLLRLLRPSRAGTAFRVLLAAGALLALSILVDLARGSGAPVSILVEDGLKLVGSALWACVPVVLHSWLTAPTSGTDAAPRRHVPPPSPRPGIDVRPRLR